MQKQDQPKVIRTVTRQVHTGTTRIIGFYRHHKEAPELLKSFKLVLKNAVTT